MKKLLSLLLLFSLLGCATKQEKPDISNTISKDKEIKDLQLGFGIDNIEEGFVYDGKPIKVSFDVEISERDSDLGLFIFVDGIYQTIEKDNQKNYCYKFTGKKDTKIKDTVSFIPNTGKKGQTLTLQAFLISDFEMVNSLKEFKNHHHLIDCAPTTLKYNKDGSTNTIKDISSTKTIELSLKNQEKLKNDSDYFNNNLIIEYPNNSNGNYKENEKVTITLTGIKDTYRVWVFEDLKPTTSYLVKTSNDSSVELEFKPQTNTKNIQVYALPLSKQFPYQGLTLVKSN